MSGFQDAFISYGRADSKAFAEKLNQRLLQAGLRSWFDMEDIPIGVDYQRQIDRGIEETHNFLFIISPHAVNSAYCAKEIDLALQYHKRIIPILHVEEISQEVWQQRHPEETEADWIAYQAAGLHSCHTHMCAEIKRINWAYFREGLDDFDAAFAALLEQFQQHQPYVEQHTQLLLKALLWQRQERHPQRLLSGDDRLAAERWLKYPVEEANLSCSPTNLHCEFITESTKNADNLMTRVFLSYAEEDRAVATLVRRHLIRQGITVWTAQGDIQSGTDFHAAIQKGIEETDNVVYLLSPDAIASKYCSIELGHAEQYHKRIIPLLVHPVAPEKLSETVRTLQHVDLTSPPGTDVYQRGMGQLLNTLRRHAEYHATHKKLLVKALKWARQNQNASILLRGHGLRQAEAWLSIARSRKRYGPSALQLRYLDASLQQPPELALDVFISYSRRDTDFARRLNEALQIHGKATWFDQESISSGTDFQQEIYRGIESCDNFLFVLSPASVQSPYCADEVAHAVRLHKRLIPLLYRPVDPATGPKALARIQWIDFTLPNSDFHTHLGELIRTLDTDRDHVRNHTRWSRRALEWHQAGRSQDLLLRGNEFALAQGWLEEAMQQGKTPKPLALQRELIAASRKAMQAERDRERRQANTLRSLLSIVANAYTQAEAQRQRAEIVQEGQIRALSRYSQALRASHQTLEARVESVRAGRQLLQQQARIAVSDTLKREVTQAVRSALLEGAEFNQLAGHAQPITDAVFTPDGSTLITTSLDSTICLWDRHGALQQTLTGHTDAVYGVCVCPDSSLATAGADNTVRLWTSAGAPVAVLTAHQDWVYSVRFSPDGQQLASCSVDRTAILWDRAGNLIHRLPHQDTVIDLCFSPDGTHLATGCVDGAVRLWGTDGTLRKTLAGHTGPVTTVQFSPDGEALISGSVDSTLRQWHLATGEVDIFEGHQDAVWKVRLSPDGQTLVSASSDNTLKFWNRAGHGLLTLPGHRDTVSAVAFHPQRPILASGSYDKTVRLWRCTIPRVKVIPAHADGVNDAALLPANGDRAQAMSPAPFITAGAEGRVRLWHSGAKAHAWAAHPETVKGVAPSPQGNLIATASTDTTVKLWHSSGDLISTLEGHRLPVRRLAFSPDGRWLASASYDKTVGIWTAAGEPVCMLEGHTDQVWDVAFLPQISDAVVLASASWDKTVRLWRWQESDPEKQALCAEALAEPWRVLEGHQDVVAGIAFSPTGDAIATASQDRTVKIWALDGTVERSLDHDQAVTAVCFSPDGGWLATAGFDRQITLWSRQGQRLQTLTGHTGTIWRLQFFENQLLSASEDGTVRIWSLDKAYLRLMGEVYQLSLEALLDRACQQIKDYLQHNLNLKDGDRALCNSG